MPLNCIFAYHCVKSVRIRNFSGPYFPTSGLNAESSKYLFGLNAGKDGPGKLRILTLLAQCTGILSFYLESLVSDFHKLMWLIIYSKYASGKLIDNFNCKLYTLKHVLS